MALTAALLAPAGGRALAIPQVVNYQVFLSSKASGLPLNGSTTLGIALYNSPTAGSFFSGALYTDCRVATVNQGRYEVAIGSKTGGIPMATFLANTSAYLEINMMSNCSTVSEALSPRIQLLDAPYSFAAAAMPVTFSSVAVVDTNVGLTGDAYSLAVTTDPGRGVYHLYVATTGLVGIGGIPTSTLTVVNGNIRISTTANSAGVVFEDQTLQITAASAFAHVMTFTSNGTFTVPAGVTLIKVEVWGGGGGGGGGNCVTITCASIYGACGGGGGGYGTGVFTVSPGASYAVTVSTGAAGGAGSAHGTSVAGGGAASTSFGSLLSAGGGSGGSPALNTGACFLGNGSAGAGGSAASGTNILGLQGGGGTEILGAAVGGLGGDSPQGGRGGAHGAATAGSGGVAPGGAGGGGSGNNVGGNGAAGEVVVYY